MCLCCIEEYTRSIAITKKECRVINRAKLCHDHLKKCENFKKRYTEQEYAEILALSYENNNDDDEIKEGVNKRKVCIIFIFAKMILNKFLKFIFILKN